MPFKSVRKCEVCTNQIRIVRRSGRKKRFCSNRCRSTARRNRNFVRSGYIRSSKTQTAGGNAAISIVSEIQKHERPFAINLIGGVRTRLTAIDRDLREAIIEIETGLARPPLGGMTAINLRCRNG